MALYVDTSALVKLVVHESETAALRRLLVSRPDEQLVTSALSRSELVRAARRAVPEAMIRARTVLRGVRPVAVTPAVLDDAAELEPAALRSLDAIHLASARQLGADLAGLVTYDRRMAAAAERHGLPLLAPA